MLSPFIALVPCVRSQHGCGLRMRQHTVVCTKRRCGKWAREAVSAGPTGGLGREQCSRDRHGTADRAPRQGRSCANTPVRPAPSVADTLRGCATRTRSGERRERSRGIRKRINDRVGVIGSLLAAEVEVERVSVADGIEERSQFRRRGRIGPGAPAAPEEGPGVEPTANLAEGHRPGDRAS